jgi:Helicase HerA, central domain
VIDIPAGHLYLGEQLDPEKRKRNGEPVLLDSADLTTHGVIVGMTGSGKTGLGVVLIEETLLAGLPALIIDPKGDLTNLLLNFPELTADEFAPWVEGDDPAAVAKQWSEGLADWDIEPARIAALRDAAEFTIYTPGSTAGVPLDIVGGLDRPVEGTDDETVADEIEGFVSGLLNMVGIEADPLARKEHILLSNLIHHGWDSGHDLTLATLVGQVQDPPLRKLGVYELDAFYPAKDRTKLAVTLNGLLASRAFAAWAEGPDLDLDRLLKAQDGARPACAIVTLAHLSDEERQFVVSLLLGKLITWMRRQPGTDRLRLLVYFDEVMGFVPPTAVPPAKKPILTLFKQARAFGVGMVLATQNPVDVDYKGLSNAGTWMIGRLQTEQDKARLLDGLSSAGGGIDVKAASDTIAGLGKREFMLREAGSEGLSLFTSRWAMSYLRGPLTRDQIATLMQGRYQPAAEQPAAAPAATQPPTEGAEATAVAMPPAEAVPVAPTVAEDVPVRWLDPAAPWAAQVGAVPNGTRLAPALVTRVSLLFDDDKLELRQAEEWESVVFPLTGTFDPTAAIAVDHDDRDLRTEGPPSASYALTDAPLGKKTFFSGAEKAIVDHLYRNRTMQVPRNRELKLAARPGETAEQFAARCQAAAQEEADKAQVALQDKYASRIAKARDQLDAAVDRISQAQAAESTRRSTKTAASAGGLLSAMLGGRRSARTVARDIGKVFTEHNRSEEAAQRVRTAENRAQERQSALVQLEADLAKDLTAIDDEWNAKASAVETIAVPLEKSDIQVVARSLVWIPVA